MGSKGQQGALSFLHHPAYGALTGRSQHFHVVNLMNGLHCSKSFKGANDHPSTSPAPLCVPIVASLFLIFSMLAEQHLFMQAMNIRRQRQNPLCNSAEFRQWCCKPATLVRQALRKIPCLIQSFYSYASLSAIINKYVHVCVLYFV